MKKCIARLSAPVDLGVQMLHKTPLLPQHQAKMQVFFCIHSMLYMRDEADFILILKVKFFE